MHIFIERTFIMPKYTIETRHKIANGKAGNYQNGKPSGVVLHSSGNQNASVENEITYMVNHQNEAFVHAWIGYDRIVEIANTDFPCWGAGKFANAKYIQIEMSEDKTLTTKQHLMLIDKACYYLGMQLAYYGIEPIDATKNGKGTVWTHNAVSKFLGDTNHVDPIAYLARHHTNWEEVFNQIKGYWYELKNGKDGSAMLGIHEKQGNAVQYRKDKKEDKPKAKKYETESGKIPSTKFAKGDEVTFTKIAKKWIKVKHSDGTWTQADPITGVDKKRPWKVKSLNGDGSVSVQNPTQPKAEFFAYDRDLQKIEPVKKNNTEPQKLAENEIRLDGVVYKVVKK